MKRTAQLGCWLVLNAALAIPFFAQVAAAQDEGTQYSLFYAEPSGASKCKMGEDFLAKFPQSQYVDGVYRTIAGGYFKLNNWPKVMELAGKADQLDPTIKPEDKVSIYSYGMIGAQQSNNAAQTIAFGEKVVAIDPNNLDALMALSSTIPNSGTTDKGAMAKAEQYARKGIEVVGKLDAKAVGMTDAEWSKQKSGIEGDLHRTIGQILYGTQDYDKAVDELISATKLAPRDGLTFYLLGLTYNQQYAPLQKQYLAAVATANGLLKSRDQPAIEEAKATADGFADAVREKRDAAIDALATATALGGPTANDAKGQLEKLYKAKNNNSTDGMDQLINSKKPAQ